MKKCSKCGRRKRLDQFYLDNRTGRPRAACKGCCRKEALANRNRNPRRARERDRDRYWKDPAAKIAQVLASRRREA